MTRDRADGENPRTLEGRLSPDGGSGKGRVDALAERLRASRREHASAGPAVRKGAVLKELREATGGLSPEEKIRLAAELRAALVPRGQGRAASGEVDDEIERLREELDAVRASASAARSDAASARKEAADLKADRDALLRENARLRAGGGGDAGPAGGEGAVLEAMRRGLIETLRDKKVTPESLRLPATEARLFRLMQELTTFLCNMEQARIRLLSEVDVGPAGGMNTMILGKYRQRVRKELQAVLENEQGSMQKLRKTLDSINRFLYGLNEAYQASYPQGVRGLLEQFDPEPMAAKSRAKLLGTDWEAAWHLFVRTRSDVSNLTPAELWENFFRSPFKKKLDEWIVEPAE